MSKDGLSFVASAGTINVLVDRRHLDGWTPLVTDYLISKWDERATPHLQLIPLETHIQRLSLES